MHRSIDTSLFLQTRTNAWRHPTRVQITHYNHYFGYKTHHLITTIPTFYNMQCSLYLYANQNSLNDISTKILVYQLHALHLILATNWNILQPPVYMLLNFFTFFSLLLKVISNIAFHVLLLSSKTKVLVIPNAIILPKQMVADNKHY